MLNEKGETNLTVTGNMNQVEFQGAYAVTNHLGVLANGGLFIPKDEDNGNGGSGKFIEVGAGYFTPVQNNFIFDTYGLMGIGSFENHLPTAATNSPLTRGDISANVFRIGVQPSFGYKTKYFSAALSARLVNLSYNKINGDLIFDNINQVTYLDDNSSNFLIEPALTVKAGLKKVKLQLQYGYSLNVSNSDFKQDKVFLTAGLNFNFK